MRQRELTEDEAEYVEHVKAVLCTATTEAGTGLGRLLIETHLDAIQVSAAINREVDSLAHAVLIECLSKGLAEEVLHALRRVIARRHLDEHAEELYAEIAKGAEITAVDIEPDFDPLRN